MAEGWRTTVYVHVAPLSDVVEHEDSDTCPCGPTLQEETRADGTSAWLVVHHSLDGREETERASTLGTT